MPKLTLLTVLLNWRKGLEVLDEKVQAPKSAHYG
jgi:hypothetical protein